MPWYDTIPVWSTIPVFALMAAALAIAAHVIFRAITPHERLRESHDVAAAIASIAGVLYSVVMGFLVGTVWESFDTAQQTADQEARYIADAFSFAGELPASQGKPIQRAIARYAIQVRDVEWNELRGGSTDSKARNDFLDAVRATLSLRPQPRASQTERLRGQILAKSTLDSLRSVGDNRVLRLSQARERLPRAIFEALILGGIIVVFFAFLFSVKNVALQMTFTGLLAATIGIFFGLILDLNAPYEGPIVVSHDTLDSVIKNNGFVEAAK